MGKLVKMFSFILVTTALALETCLQEQVRLRAQVRQLEARVKLQQVKIAQLLHEKEVQFLDKGEETSVIHLGSKREYADCSEIFNDGHKQSGFYKIKPLQSPEAFSVYCDMSDGGGWTVVQRRTDGSGNFHRGWDDYENGFGNFVRKNGEYWLGNKKLHLLTTQEFLYVKDWEYSGTAGDSFAGNFHPEVQWWASHQGMKFSTWDRDNDNYSGNCAEEEKSGWWFNRCHSSNLNGLYYGGPYTADTDNGVVWYSWHGWWYSLKSVAMKIRPNDFTPNIV